MNRQLQVGVFLLVAALAGTAGYYFNQASLSSQAIESAAKKLMLAPLTDLNGRMQTLSISRAKVLLVNFWATWCTPCREEIPALMKIQDKYSANGVQIAGIALDDVAKVSDYASEININYDFLIGNADTLLISKDLGNQAGVLPFTVILDRAGKVVYTHAGALTEAALDAVLAPLL